MSDVFISYNRGEKDVAKRLAERLESEGFSVWWDQQLPGGDSFADTIERELNRASAVLVLCTPAALASSWVREEANYAREQNKLIPLMAGDTNSYELPIGLRDVQGVHIDDWFVDRRNADFNELRAAIRRLIDAPEGKSNRNSTEQDVRNVGDLKPGMVLSGVVTRVTAFGAFIDVGVRQDGLVHVSELADKFVKDPRDVVKVGDTVRVRVKEVDINRKRIALSMKSESATRKNEPPNHLRTKPAGAAPQPADPPLFNPQHAAPQPPRPRGDLGGARRRPQDGKA